MGLKHISTRPENEGRVEDRKREKRKNLDAQRA